MFKTVNFDNTPEQDLLDLINQDNDLNLTLDVVSLSLPIPVAEGDRNTRVIVTSNDRRRFIGYKDVYYNRISLNQFGTIELLAENAFTVDSALVALSDKLNVDLTLADIKDLSFLTTMSPTVVKTGLLTANPNSYRWTGSTMAEFCYGIPANIGDLSYLFRNILVDPNYLPHR